MIIRIVRMSFRKEAVEDFLHIFNSSKNRIRNFPGCLHLELHRDAENPAVFCTYSHWDTQESLDSYRNSELFGNVWPATKALFSARPIAFSNVIEEVVKN